MPSAEQIGPLQDVLRRVQADLLSPDNEIIAVTDWEFTYVAPTQFLLDPPWWLLFERPEIWQTIIGDWTRAYELQLKMWLEAVEE